MYSSTHYHTNPWYSHFSRRCRTLNTLLVLNSTIGGLIFNVTNLSQAIYQLISDGNDLLCSFRGLILAAGTGLLYHTLCIQPLYRLFVTVFSTRRYLITTRFISCLVIIQWIFTIIYGIPIFIAGRITYRIVDRICFIDLGIFNYVLPLALINGIYLRIIKYMKQTASSTAVRQSTSEQQRRRREIRLIRCILMIVIILFIMGFPYLLFFLIFQFNQSLVPNNIYTICSFFIGFGISVTMLFNIINTDDVRSILIDIIRSKI